MTLTYEVEIAVEGHLITMVVVGILSSGGAFALCHGLRTNKDGSPRQRKNLIHISTPPELDDFIERVEADAQRRFEEAQQ
jgi:hypothetical protein